MHDIRLIRDDPATFDAAMAKRNIPSPSENILRLDAHRRAVLTELQGLLVERKRLSSEAGALIGRARKRDAEYRGFIERLEEIGATASSRDPEADVSPDLARDFMRIQLQANRVNTELKADQEYRQVLEAQSSTITNEVKSHESKIGEYDQSLHEVLTSLPNLPLADVPEGADEADNVLVHERGERPDFAFAPREHDAIGPALGLDFERGAAMSGARFTLLRGAAARLSRALGQFMLDRLTGEHGYELVAPPLMVRDEAVFGTGQLPKFADDLFKTTDGRWLIPTAEVSLTNIVRETILPEAELPLRFAALTPCFRSEAGAAGRDTRGFIRQHQFDKVEMVSVVAPHASEAEHERMTACAEAILDALGLAYRRMKLCAGDMGFTAARTYDLEVWLPGQARYREISSCSTCTDFQARRMNARYRPEGQDKGPWPFVHTLNGSGLAVGRTLVAVIENGQREDGSVTVPAVLRPYLGGDEVLAPR